MKTMIPVLVHKKYRHKIDRIYRIPARFCMAAKYYIVFADGFQSHSRSESPCFSKEILLTLIRDAYEVDSAGVPVDEKLRTENEALRTKYEKLGLGGLKLDEKTFCPISAYSSVIRSLRSSCARG